MVMGVSFLTNQSRVGKDGSRETRVLSRDIFRHCEERADAAMCIMRKLKYFFDLGCMQTRWLQNNRNLSNKINLQGLVNMN